LFLFVFFSIIFRPELLLRVKFNPPTRPGGVTSNLLVNKALFTLPVFNKGHFTLAKMSKSIEIKKTVKNRGKSGKNRGKSGKMALKIGDNRK